MGQINKKLILIKLHYFLFMGAMGPILPFLNVFGKQLEISEVIMGIINAILPFFFLVAKPTFGFTIDYFHNQRKVLFMLLLTIMSISFSLLYIIPASCRHLCKYTQSYPYTSNTTYTTDIRYSSQLNAISNNNMTCAVECNSDDLYTSVRFWLFVLFMSIGCIGFNIINSVSDAICFDMLGDGGEKNYGKQRVFGTIGFGLTALLGGYGIDFYSKNSDIKDYTPAFLILIFFSVLDLICCFYIRLPKMPQSKNIMKDVSTVIKEPYIRLFLLFAVLMGFCDGFIIYNLFWYLEDLGLVTKAANIKLLEGLTVAAETLFGEVIFFSFSGKIMDKLGYGHCLSFCFFCYFLRFGLISLIPSPWFVLPIELLMQGPTYALGYTTIVAYASAISPPGTSATMQGLIAGVDDGFGYAMSSFIGGILYSKLGGNIAFKIFSMVALLSSITHSIAYSHFMNKKKEKEKSKNEITLEDGQNSLLRPSKSIDSVDS